MAADMTLPYAQQHNQIFRGQELNTVYSVDEVLAMIRDNSFRDLYLGDYFRLPTFDSSNPSGDPVLMFAGFNVYPGIIGSNKPHAVMITYDPYRTDLPMDTTGATQINNTSLYAELTSLYNTLKSSSDTIESGIANAIIGHTWEFGIYDSTNRNSIGNTGGCNAMGSDTFYFRLPTEFELFGTTMLSSSVWADVGSYPKYLPLFRLKKEMQDTNDPCWLAARSGVDGDTSWAVTLDGAVEPKTATEAGSVRPLCIIG